MIPPFIQTLLTFLKNNKALVGILLLVASLTGNYLQFKKGNVSGADATYQAEQKALNEVRTLLHDQQAKEEEKVKQVDQINQNLTAVLTRLEKIDAGVEQQKIQTAKRHETINRIATISPDSLSRAVANYKADQ